MNNFWNENVSDVMENNGTNASAVERQQEEAHLHGTCDGGSLTDTSGCPACSKLLKDQAKADLRADCVRRNTRLFKLAA